MKKLIAMFTFLGTIMAYGQVNWMSMDKALEAQKKQPKKIMVKFHADWCPYCRKMDAETFSHPDIIKYINENYYAVHFNIEGGEEVNFKGNKFTNPHYDPSQKPTYGGAKGRHQFADFMNVRSYPTTMFIDENQDVITAISGALGAKDIEPTLAVIATDDYKKIKTQEDWNNYMSKFKSKIKE